MKSTGNNSIRDWLAKAEEGYEGRLKSNLRFLAKARQRRQILELASLIPKLFRLLLT